MLRVHYTSLKEDEGHERSLAVATTHIPPNGLVRHKVPTKILHWFRATREHLADIKAEYHDDILLLPHLSRLCNIRRTLNGALPDRGHQHHQTSNRHIRRRPDQVGGVASAPET